MSRRYDRIAAWLLPRKRGAHIAVLLLTLLMIPGAMTALQPIDMESYEMESPELSAQTIVNEEFPNAESSSGSSSLLAIPTSFRPWRTGNPCPAWPTVRPTTHRWFTHPKWFLLANRGAGIDDPTGGILNLTVLRGTGHQTEPRARTPARPSAQAAGERRDRATSPTAPSRCPTTSAAS